jgi:hypothetical protein
MVEMAIVVPIFVLLLFGMLEFGLAFKDKLAMAHAVTRASRDASVLGNEDIADIEILRAFEDGLVGAVSIDSVVHVDIFKAGSGGSPIVWDRYVPDADGVPCEWDPCPDPTIVGSVVYGNPAGYPPCIRDTAFDPTDGLDTIGVQVEYTHTWVTGVLGFSKSTWHEATEARIEPKRFGAENPSC